MFTRLFGAGFIIVIEGRAGISGRPPGTLLTVSDPASRPDVQILASHNLGNGSAAVCDSGPAPDFPIGGVPGFDPPNFDDPSQTVTDALNDLACRLADNTALPCTSNSRDIPDFVSDDGTTQVCSATVVGTELEFPPGDTLLVAQWRDNLGNIGHQVKIVVRIQNP